MIFQLATSMWLAMASDPVFWRGTVEIGNEYKASGGPGRELGFAVSIDGDTAVLGAPSFGTSFTWVHVYERVAGQWTPTAFLEPLDPARDFGLSVALEGDTLIVGAPRRDTYALETGAAHVFERDPNTGEWFEAQILAPDDLASGAQFGYYVDLQDGTLFVSAPSQDNFRGAVYVYESVDGVWVQVQKISSSTGFYFGFGMALSRDGDTALIGSAGENSFRGAAYVYRYDGAQWVQEQRLIAPDRAPDDTFGVGVAIHDDLVVVGSPSDQIGKFWEAGSAYVFRNINGMWTFEQKITQPEPWYENNLGFELHIHEGVIYVASFERFLTHAQGALYTFEHDGTEWVNTLRLVPSDAQPPTYGGQGFAASIAIDGNTLLAGAYRDDTHGTNSGAGYFYTIGPESEAALTDVTVAFGTLISGGLPELLASDDQWLRVRSHFGFSAFEPNVLDIRIGADATNLSAEEIDLSIEGRLNQNGGTAKLRLRKWTTNQLIQVHQYPIGSQETDEAVIGIDNTDFIRQADGRIELSTRQSVFTTFSASGFQSFTDRVVITLR